LKGDCLNGPFYPLASLRREIRALWDCYSIRRGVVMRRYWTRQNYPFLKSLVPAAKGPRNRRSAQRELNELRMAYADLLDEHVSMWSDFVMHGTPLHGATSSDSAAGEGHGIVPLLEADIHEIMSHCRGALADLETSSSDSLERHKAIGKILAYGRVTSILHRLQLRVATMEAPDIDSEAPAAAAAKKRFTN
jgi:hypothetical protein